MHPERTGWLAAWLSVLLAGQAGAVEPFSLISWSEPGEDFGGFSGLELTDGGKGFLAVSDRGRLVQARIARDADGRLQAVTLEAMLPLIDNQGQVATGFHGDAEALRQAPDGSLLIAFESYARVARFHLPDLVPVPLNHWDRFRDRWGNEGMESLALSAKGEIITVLERPGMEGSYHTLVYGGGVEWHWGPELATDGAYAAVDADFGPDGQLYLLERSYIWGLGFRTRLSAYQPAGAGFAAPKVVLESDRGQFGDFEGLDVWRDAQGQMRATMISDNNFGMFRGTELAEFLLGR